LKFELLAGGAVSPRAGRLSLGHGVVETPAFMPVGTRGTVKAIDTMDLRRLDPGIILANAYHLWMAPGGDAVARAGGLHEFIGWGGNILTDSGGYQAVSLDRAGTATIDEDGVRFRDGEGAERHLTPELAIAVQEEMAPDVMMALDHPVGYPAAPAVAEAATERTHRWAQRCHDAWSRGPTELFGIVQGGFEPGLRQRSARAIEAMNVPGNAIGGLSLGEPAALGRDLVMAVNAELATDKPRYLMGVGSEPELLDAIAAGVDLFDCVWPTRLARTGSALVGPGRINISNAAHTQDPRPLEEGCTCAACRGHSRAQLRYLFLRGELLGYRLLTIHNLHHTLDLARLARAAITAGEFAEFQSARIYGADIIRRRADK
jgi:queuine tRNA-ribosyltransferase